MLSVFCEIALTASPTRAVSMAAKVVLTSWII
nr:MAG TPA: hypothetical protein [Bacteriophage sp.]